MWYWGRAINKPLESAAGAGRAAITRALFIVKAISSRHRYFTDITCFVFEFYKTTLPSVRNLYCTE